MSLSSLMFTSGRTASDLLSIGPALAAGAPRSAGASRRTQYQPLATASTRTAENAPTSQRLAPGRGAPRLPAPEIVTCSGATSQIGIGSAMFLKDSGPPNCACIDTLPFTVSYTVWLRQI